MVSSDLTPIVIAGATASGKSDYAMSIAEKKNIEIICADSRQFYLGMAIGTAAPSMKDKTLVPHHGYGDFDPKCIKLNAGDFVTWVKRVVEEVQKRSATPVLVGGTGLYLRSLRYGFSDVPPSCEVVRQELCLRQQREGLEVLFEELSSIDIDTANSISANDAYRIIRALEIFYVTNKKPSYIRKSFYAHKPNFLAKWFYLVKDREELNKRIISRVHQMYEQGFIEETKKLRERLGDNHWALQVMGYHEALLCLDNKIDFKAAIDRTIIRHRQYAKRQQTWFRKEEFYKKVDPSMC